MTADVCLSAGLSHTNTHTHTHTSSLAEGKSHASVAGGERGQALTSCL